MCKAWLGLRAWAWAQLLGPYQNLRPSLGAQLGLGLAWAKALLGQNKTRQ